MLNGNVAALPLRLFLRCMGQLSRKFLACISPLGYI